jgi:hypothetical protein
MDYSKQPIPIPGIAVPSDSIDDTSPTKPQPNPQANPQANPPAAHDWSRFEQLVKRKELNPGTAAQLKDVLSTCEIVLLCDDSDSMAQAIAEEGTNPFAIKRSTRWLELMRLASVIIEFVTAINPNGLDIYFLNRETIRNVNNSLGLQAVFNAPPSGGTPLIRKLNQVYMDKRNFISQNRKLLVVVITDGEPTDGTRNDLFDKLVEITRSGNVHVSFAECTDNAEDMEYLDAWDGNIRNFDNTDDYREELQRVKMCQGQQFKFDYTDYVIKILLATFVRWYFNLDQSKVYDPRNNINNANPNDYGNNYQFQPQQPLQYQAPAPVLAAPPIITSVYPAGGYSVYPPMDYNAPAPQQCCNQYNPPNNRQKKSDCILF